MKDLTIMRDNFNKLIDYYEKNDITIEDKDVPAGHFWTASEIYENDGVTLKNEFASILAQLYHLSFCLLCLG